MNIDRTTPLTGDAWLEMMARDEDARASLACEGMHFTEEEALFAEMARLKLSYGARIEHLKAYLGRTAPALASE